LFVALDTLETAPGLAANVARTFEMRATSVAFAPAPEPGVNDLPIRTYGVVTTNFTSAFLRGHIHEVAAPICGQTRVFHLLTVN